MSTATAVSLTELETKMVNRILTDDYNSDWEEGCPWSWSVCGSTSQAAVLGSLVKKGLCWTQGAGNDAMCGFTDEGKRISRNLFPRPW